MITVGPEDEKNGALLKKLLLAELKKQQAGAKLDSPEFVFEKKSIDARHGKFKLHLKYKAYVGQKPAQTALPAWRKVDGGRRVIIVGSGPAGLFGALTLLEHGIMPIIVERGEETFERKRSIAKISTQSAVNSDSNYCFGEGGAGTFSDGKLYTRSNKRGDISRILAIFAHFGADKKILTDAHPHIGTDKLPGVINAMKAFITEMGGRFYFNTRCTDFIIEKTEVNGTMLSRVTGIRTSNTKNGEQTELYADATVLATGHSAKDIYEMVSRIAPGALEAKTFAVGVRAEHPRSLIDGIQYHGKAEGMGAAEYRLVTQIQERGVYSFCMCPGGFVVPSASDKEGLVVNGMSAAGRNSRWSNAAIVVETRPEDIPAEFREQAKTAGCEALAGLYFRTALERLTKQNGKAQAAPAQRMQDFIERRESNTLPDTSYTPGVVPSRLDQWLFPQIAERLRAAFLEFNKSMKGFVSPDALLIASETRTSTPVRILRNKDTLQSPALSDLYPCGEGAGYSGGIVSSAMDGEKVCAQIAKNLNEGRSKAL